MKYLLSGGTGFIGSALIAALGQQEDCTVTVLTRRAKAEERRGHARVRYIAWDGRTQGEWAEEMAASDIVINLAGKNLFSGRWNDRLKAELIASRIDPVRALIGAMNDAKRKPSLFISVSAVGYYGDTNGMEVSETSRPGNDFLARLVREWEEAALEASALGVRTALPRLGIVLGRDGGALEKLALPFYFFAGGYLGSGRQYLSWIHMDDLVRAILYPAGHEGLSGPYNCTSPFPVTMKELCQAIGRALHRPCWTSVPSVVVRAALGEASSMLLTGQRALPERLHEEGFHFHYGHADDALRNIFRR